MAVRAVLIESMGGLERRPVLHPFRPDYRGQAPENLDGTRFQPTHSKG